VVYFPDRKKKRIIKEKTSVVFSQLNKLINEFIKTTFEAFDENFNEKDDLKEKWERISKESIDKNLNKIKSQKENTMDSVERKSIKKDFSCSIEIKWKNPEHKYIHALADISKNIEYYKGELSSLYIFLEIEELEFYLKIKSMDLFNNLKGYDFFSLLRGTVYEEEFIKEFRDIIDLKEKLKIILPQSVKF